MGKAAKEMSGQHQTVWAAAMQRSGKGSRAIKHKKGIPSKKGLTEKYTQEAEVFPSLSDCPSQRERRRAAVRN